MRRIIYISLIFSIAAVLALPGSLPVMAASPTPWSAVIAYFYPSKADCVPVYPATSCVFMNVLFMRHDDNTRRDLLNDIQVNNYQSGTLYIGNILNDPTFTGSAVVSATEQIITVYKQVSSESNPHSMMLYTSFQNDDAGSGVFYIPHVQMNQGYDTRIGIQNVDGTPAQISLELYPDDGGPVLKPKISGIYDKWYELNVQRSLIINVSQVLADIPNAPAEFSGSLVIRSCRAGTDPCSNAKVVAVAQDIQGGGKRAYAYEGIKNGGNAVFMPSALCDYSDNKQSTYFNVQNTGTQSTQVQIDYYNTDGGLVATTPSHAVNAGYQYTFDPCQQDDPFGVYASIAGQSLSAVIRSNGQPLSALGMVRSDDGLLTAYTGMLTPAAPKSGPYRVVIPYVDWSSKVTGNRTYFYVMNVSGQPANDVKVTYYPAGGIPDDSHEGDKTIQQLASGSNTLPGPLMPYSRRTSSPSSAHALSGNVGGFNGGAIIESDQPVVVVVRVVRTVTGNGPYKMLGDDYSGIPYQDVTN